MSLSCGWLPMTMYTENHWEQSGLLAPTVFYSSLLKFLFQGGIISVIKFNGNPNRCCELHSVNCIILVILVQNTHANSKTSHQLANHFQINPLPVHELSWQLFVSQWPQALWQAAREGKYRRSQQELSAHFSVKTQFYWYGLSYGRIRIHITVSSATINRE